MEAHSPDAQAQLADFHIGTLDGHLTPKGAVIDDGTGPFLNPDLWKTVLLMDVKVVSHDTRLFRFKLQRPDQELGLRVGQHADVRLRRKPAHNAQSDNIEGEIVRRPYTPVSKQNDRGIVELLIKYADFLLNPPLLRPSLVYRWTD